MNRAVFQNTPVQAVYRFLSALRHQFGMKFAWMKGVSALTGFVGEYQAFRRLGDNPNFKAAARYLYPCLIDRTAQTPVEPIYFFQDTWAARKIFELKPSHHYDVGSHVVTMGIVSQFTPVTLIDLRPISVELENLHFEPGSILELPFPDETIESLSSLCVIEHIGLGRYGDPLDPWGSEKAARELQRVLKRGGNLLISVPVDADCRIYFNAHRAFTRQYVIEIFNDLKLIEERYIYGTSVCIDYAPASGFGTGLFHFQKPLTQP
jgi:SAM-dependent methyltransferase